MLSATIYNSVIVPKLELSVDLKKEVNKVEEVIVSH